jgi:hypothetical protein
MPPPQPWGLPLEENVKVSSSSKVRVVLDPPPFVPVTYVAKAPISNSFPLKNETGGGGGGAIICLEETTGSPAKVATACDAAAIIAKATSFFIGFVFLTEIQFLLICYSLVFWFPLSKVCRSLSFSMIMSQQHARAFRGGGVGTKGSGIHGAIYRRFWKSPILSKLTGRLR